MPRLFGTPSNEDTWSVVPTLESALTALTCALAGVALLALIVPAPANAGIGKFKVADGDAYVQPGVRLQSLYTLESEDGAERNLASEFSVPRARLSLKGKLPAADTSFKMQLGFGKGNAVLKDLYMDYSLVGVKLRLGQYKRPFSRQTLSSSGKLVLVDRAITAKAFDGGRDIGLMLHNGFGRESGLEWALGVFNGAINGANADKPKIAVDGDSAKASNLDGDHAPSVVGRLVWNSDGLEGYDEVDFKGGGLRYGVGASVRMDFDADGGDDGQMVAGVDAIIKVTNFSLVAEGFIRQSQKDSSVTSFTAHSVGGHIQAGSLIGDMWFPAARLALVEPDGGEDTQTEIAVGLAVFPNGHNLAWHNDITLKSTKKDGDTSSDIIVRSMLQLSF